MDASRCGNRGPKPFGRAKSRDPRLQEDLGEEVQDQDRHEDSRDAGGARASSGPVGSQILDAGGSALVDPVVGGPLRVGHPPESRGDFEPETVAHVAFEGRSGGQPLLDGRFAKAKFHLSFLCLGP